MLTSIPQTVSAQDVLNPSVRIETQFASDRATWRLLSLQTRLKAAKTPETRAAIVRAIQDCIRTMSLLYSDVHTEGYRSGVEFGKQNAAFYAHAEQMKRTLPHRKIEVRTVDRRPCMVVNGRSID
ncbi:hypothetical protein [Leptolyngbya sp. NIES-2104]|uniref:hypothetical protein n=1 Tax=Leptolyngbya sp. NIES-2104 TaxID=1552121 RepID=UPI0006EC69B9|nr:hypothetical protein [Leptolyngbya sp. NIES-2104]GAP96095.1 hypothetical protein NIES2104_26300 [Leptolyngbya sp. NIES-2104]